MRISGQTSARPTSREAREQRQRSIALDAAEVEFAAAGFEDARIHGIAERARMALGTLYGLYPGKHELYGAVHVRRLGELFASVVVETTEADRALDGIRAGMRALIRFFVQHPDYLTMHLRDGQAWSSTEHFRTSVQRDAWGRGFELMRALFTRAQRDGDMREGDADLDARLAIASQQVFMARWLERTPRQSADEVFAATWGFLDRAFVLGRRDETENER